MTTLVTGASGHLGNNVVRALLARGRKVVVLCGHGWFNRMTRKILRRRGWQCVYDGGDSYWAWRRYEPPGPIGSNRGCA